LTDENVGGQSASIISHTHNVSHHRVGLQAHVTELSNESLTVTVDQPHPPVTNSDKPHPLTCSEAHPPDSEPHSAETDNDSEKPLPLHASSNDPLLHASSNNEPHPHTSSNDKPHPVAADKTTSDHQTTVLVPSNQLLFELD